MANVEFAYLFDPYCLGMCSWTGCLGNADMATPASWPYSEFERPPSCASQLHPSMDTTSRFAFASEEELSKLAERVTPANTAKTTAWALNNFLQWMASGNRAHPSDSVPEDILQCTDPQLLNIHLSMWLKQGSQMEMSTLPQRFTNCCVAL